MNHSPINDPGFKKIREEARLKAGKKRRIRTLTLLVITTMLALACTVLLCNAALDAAPGLLSFFEKEPNHNHTLPDFSPIIPPSESDSSDLHLPDSSGATENSNPPSGITDPNIHVTTIYIDAGHGYANSEKVLDVGAGEDTFYYELSDGLYEKDLNLMIAKKVQVMLESRGYVVIMSRSGDVFQPLSITDRAARVAASGADCSVSIHGNTVDNPNTRGARVYYCDRRSTPATRQQFAASVAAAIDNRGASAIPALFLEDHNAKMENGAGLAMCGLTGKVPSILVETCFLTNKEDAQMALSDAWQTAMAEAIVDGIVENFPWSYHYIDKK